AQAADVDFYSFSLQEPARVRIAAPASLAGGTQAPVLSLYDEDPWESTGHRLLAQAEGDAGGSALERTLGAGTDFLAVGGPGNRYSPPFLADSGYAGATGEYQLTITDATVGQPAGGPAVLAADPADGDTLSGAPLVLRVSLSAPLDTNTIGPGTVRL